MKRMVRTAVVAAGLVFLTTTIHGSSSGGIGPVTVTCEVVDLQNVVISEGSAGTYDLLGRDIAGVPRTMRSTITLTGCLLVPTP